MSKSSLGNEIKEKSAASSSSSSSSSEVHHRVVALQDIDGQFLDQLYHMLKVVPIGKTAKPDEGRIATNIIQDTDKGKLMIRIYPKAMPDKLETGNPIFEIQALDHFASHGVKVPIPVRFNDKLFFETDDQVIFGYFLIPGEGVKQSMLSVELASEMGRFLNSMFLPAAVKYKPGLDSPLINSFSYILEIANKIEDKYPELKKIDIWSVMKDMTQKHLGIIDGTPTGIVHADYFFENILVDDKNSVSGLIDFGDAYYSHVLNDVVIGAMEASVLEDNTWDLNMFRAFLQETSPFLISNSISFEQFIETLKVNCLRFAVYTVSFTVDEGKQILENQYINRYQKLLQESFVEQIDSLYSQCTHAHEQEVEMPVSGDTGSFSFCNIL